MPSARHQTRARATAAQRPDSQATNASAAAAPNAEGEALQSPPRPKQTKDGTRRRRAEQRASERLEGALNGLLRGLRAGDLESVLLTVAMAADENRMPSADPDEAARILAFLARLADYDAALPPNPGGAGVGPERSLDAG